MKILKVTVVFLWMVSVLYSQTDVSGTVSGTWNTSGSPYNVIGNITVASATTLTIDAGVSVIFQGDYSFNIDGGTLNAIGTSSDSIIFNIGGSATEFDGIRFINSGTGTISYAHIENSTVEGVGNERYGGAILCDGTSATISHCLIKNNTAATIGGGIALYNSGATVEDCIIHNNSAQYAAGIYVRGNAIIRRNIIHTNSAAQLGGGLNILQAYSPTVENNIIYNNTSNSNGGGICCLLGNTGTITNNVIYNNSANNNGGGIYMESASTNVVANNNILWSNGASGSGPEIYIEDGTLSIDYSDVQNGLSGTATNLGTLTYGANNINSTPNFISTADNDFQLASNSPCIDVGTSTNAPSTDFDQNPTNQDGNNDATLAYDMGAFEFLQDVNNYSSSGSQNFNVNNFQGSPTQIAGVNLNSLTGSGDVTINCYTKSMPINSPENSKAVRRWYHIEEGAGLVYGTANLTLYYSQDEFNLSGLASESNITLWYSSGSSWINKSGTWTNTGDGGYVQISGETSLEGYWAFADLSDSALPVTLSSFSAQFNNNAIEIYWETFSEIANEGFEIWEKRSYDDGYKMIDSYLRNSSLKGQINSSSRVHYKYTNHNYNLNTTYYYMIYSVSQTGEREAFGPVKITPQISNGEVPSTFFISNNYPNPFNPSTSINLSFPEKTNVKILIYNLAGQVVDVIEDKNLNGGKTIVWSPNNLSSGVYFYAVFANNSNLKNRRIKIGKMIFMK